MEELEYLILHYSLKNQNWYDATKSVFAYKRLNKYYVVKFANSDNWYRVSLRHFKVFQNPEEVKFGEVYYKKVRCVGAKKVLLFNHQIYKIIYESGYSVFGYDNEVKIIKDVLKESAKASGVFEYYKNVIQETCKSEEDFFLLSQFDDIDNISEESVLSLYLKGRLEKNEENFKHPFIFPFDLNYNQAIALENSFKNRISIIEGPPGTGKTQTILNIISNAIINNKSVAVVSNNNAATDNIFEKLKKYQYSFLCAPLGNADNVEKFFEEYNSDIPLLIYENLDNYKLGYLYKEIKKYYLKTNNKQKLIEELDEIKLEYKHFILDNSDFDFENYKIDDIHVSDSYILKTLIRIKEKERLGLFERLSIRFKLHIKNSTFNKNKDKWILVLENLYYQIKISKIEEKLKFIDESLKYSNFTEKLEQFKTLSNIYFKNQLIERFKNSFRSVYQKNNYKRNFETFVKDFPVILSSTYSLAKCSQKGYLFDYLIVDESSQVNMASAILSMRIARNIIIVGDIKQLPQIDDSEFKEKNEQLLKEFNIPLAYSYYGNSIMSSFLSLYKDKIVKTMLKEHYRCAPEIIGFCNKKFYDNQLIVYSSKKDNLSMRVIKTVAGNFARKNPDGSGLYNQREIDEISNLLKSSNYTDIGIISPYRYQASLIENSFDDIESSTIHKFQGREKKTIIFSSTINDVNEFVGNENLINVAVSRAIDNFILVTSDKVARSKAGVLSDLINYIQYNNFGSYENGNVKSIYDLLYNDYNEELNRFMRTYPSNDFASENLTKVLINSILKDPKYKSLSFKMHVSLRNIFKLNREDLNEREYSFYKNPLSHVDFLVFNTINKEPLFGIEVDGVSFHEQNANQKERDGIKDKLFNIGNLKLIRLKTNQGNEEEIIRKVLNEYVGD